MASAIIVVLWLFVSLFSIVVMLAVSVAPIALVALLVHLVWKEQNASPTAPRRHPEPIAGWIRTALAPFDRGQLWLDWTPDRVREALARWWNVHRVEDWARAMRALLTHPGPLTAWDGLRAIRITMQAARLGWITEALAWELVGVIASELQRSYDGFSSLAHDYDRAGRAERPDEIDVQARTAAIRELEASAWWGVRFAQPLVEDGVSSRDRAWVVRKVEAIAA